MTTERSPGVIKQMLKITQPRWLAFYYSYEGRNRNGDQTKTEVLKLKRAPRNLPQVITIQKENKELLTYLLFEADDPELYIRHVKEELAPLFAEVNVKQVYFAKKTIRKILRMARRFIRYSGSKTAEVEILLYFLAAFKDLDLPMRKNPLLQNIYNAQVKKIQAAIDTMHEDLQHDYQKQLKLLV